MTLPSSGAISINDIAAEFGISASSVFPTAFYGLGGAPSSGALSFSDFYGRSSGSTPTPTPSPTANASPTSLTQNGIAATQDTASCACTASGGSGGYTYNWVKVSGDAITVNTPAASITTFRASMLAPGEFRTTTFKCIVTDSSSQSASSNDVTVSIGRGEL